MTLIKVACFVVSILRIIPWSLSKSLTLEEIVPDDYDKMLPPKINSEPAKVFFHVTIMHMDSVDDSSMTYKCDIFLAQSWIDHRLQFSKNMNKNVTAYRQIPVEWLEHIWKPDTFFKNAKTVELNGHTVPNHYIWLWHNNTILYTSKYSLQLVCSMSFVNYPHDEQTCFMSLESISYTSDDIEFFWEETNALQIESKVEMPQLTVTDMNLHKKESIYSVGNFTSLEIEFKLKRNLGQFLIFTYFPTILIVMVSWMSFWMKPENIIERIMLGVTSLLTIFAQHAISIQSLPPVSYLKAIDLFMNLCTVFVFVSLVEFIVISKILSSYDHPDSPISITKQQQNKKQEDPTPKSTQSPEEIQEMVEEHKIAFGLLAMPKTREDCWRLAHQIDRTSRLVFPVLFTILNGIYWIYYTVL